jgi:hypothetical protein
MEFTLPIGYSTLTQPQRRLVREKYRVLQKDLCAHCEAPLTEEPASKIRKKKINESLFPPNFLQYPIHLHHHHDTDMTIGAVHALCNAVLWQYHGE